MGSLRNEIAGVFRVPPFRDFRPHEGHLQQHGVALDRSRHGHLGSDLPRVGVVAAPATAWGHGGSQRLHH